MKLRLRLRTSALSALWHAQPKHIFDAHQSFVVVLSGKTDIYLITGSSSFVKAVSFVFLFAGDS